MADFDRNLQPIIKETGYKASDIPLLAPKDFPMNFSSGKGGGLSDLSQKEDVFAELAAAGQKFSQKGLFVSNAELEANKRYKTFNPTIGDYEDFAHESHSTGHDITEDEVCEGRASAHSSPWRSGCKRDQSRAIPHTSANHTHTGRRRHAPHSTL